ncbi:MAG TPA: galactokinase [Bacteroidales bacterium]|nr:galactokinase [Bacteroidales bacterium]HPT02325.1 galactokinase [Bacteroidales bacterium]
MTCRLPAKVAISYQILSIFAGNNSKTTSMAIAALQKEFKSRYGIGEAPALFFAPGRVNIIGEHTDYNGGYVLPCALSFGTYLAVRPNGERRMRFATFNFSYAADVPFGDLAKKQGSEWVNYPLGVIDQFVKKGVELQGFDMLFSGDIPNGAGLSSSASIELVTAVALDEMLDSGIDRIELIKMGRAAENQFVGMNCGIMDQFAVGMGKASSAIFLNCRTLEYELVPVEMEGYSIVIMNTNKRRELADSKYNERVRECASALESLRSIRPLTDLSDMEIAEFLENEKVIADKTIRNRARHVISENRRVLDAVAAMKRGDLTTLGKLMNASHESLRTDYEVTGKELDTIVHEAWKVEGVVGARMTGAGFGGCAVAIVDDDSIDELIACVGPVYHATTGLSADFYVASVGNGAGRIG